MKNKIYVSELLLSHLVEQYEREKDARVYEDYDDHKRLNDDDMCHRYYVMESEKEDTETFCLLGHLDEDSNFIIDEELLEENEWSE